jgi:hypothetical protein
MLAPQNVKTLGDTSSNVIARTTPPDEGHIPAVEEFRELSLGECPTR